MRTIHRTIWPTVLGVVFVCFSLLLGLTFNTVYAVTNSITFQGKIVVNANGTNLVPGSPSCIVNAGADTCDFRVRIFDAASGGNLLFTEDHLNVEIGDFNGVFNLAINSVCNSSGSDWTTGGCVSNGGVDFSDPSIWIQLEFDPSGNADFTEGEVFSRTQFSKVPHAFYADRAGSLAENGNGFIQNGNLFGSLATLGTNDNFDLALETNGTERIRVNTNGQVGFGTNLITNAQIQIQTGTISSNGVTMAASNGSTTFTTSASVTLYAGDLIIPNSLGTQARVVAATNTGTSFTVTQPFTFNVSSRIYTVSRKTLISGPRPILSLQNVLAPFSPQEWQLRVGAVAPGSLDIFNQTANQTAFLIDDEGDVIIGANQNYGGVGNASRLYVYGGNAGANIDVMGNGALSDQATVELQSSDYETTAHSLYTQYYGVNGTGTTFGFNNQYLGAIMFQGDNTTAIIGTNSPIPLILGTNNIERLRLDANGNLGLGVTNANAFFDIKPATVDSAQVNLSSSGGINPTTPTSGDLWWNGSNLLFFDGTNTVDLASCSSGCFRQNGNSFGTVAKLGTSDSNTLDLITNGMERVQIQPDGSIFLSRDTASLYGLDITHNYIGSVSGGYNIRSDLSVNSSVVGGNATGINNILRHNSNTSAGNLDGFSSLVNKGSGTGTVSALRGIYSRVQVQNGGAVTNAFGLFIDSASDTGTSFITNNYGVFIGNQTAGLTSDIGLYIDGAQNQSIYVNSGNSFFNGNVGIRSATASPTNPLEVTANMHIDTSGRIRGTTLGTAALPSYSFLGDTNTGIYSSAADTLAVSTAGTQRLSVNTVGLAIGLASATNALTVQNTASGTATAYIYNAANSSTAIALTLQGCENIPTAGCNLVEILDGDGTQAGRIQITAAGATAYQTTSDRRAKKNITNTAFGLSELLRVNVKDFEYVNSNLRTTGFIAQELYDVYPSAVGVGLNPEDLWGVDYGSLTPLIIKGVQDLNEKVDNLADELRLSDSNQNNLIILDGKFTLLEDTVNELNERVTALEQAGTLNTSMNSDNLSDGIDNLQSSQLIRGAVTILEGSTTISVNFGSTIIDPIITVSGINFDGKYKIVNTSNTGFDIEITEIEPVTGDVLFNWIAIAK